MKIQVKIMAILMFLTTFAIIACSPGGWGTNTTPTATYTVTFDSQSATVAADPTSKTITSPATTVDALPTEPTKLGFTFGGWYTATDGGGTEFTAATIVTADITVYAKWTEKLVYAIGDTGPGSGIVFYVTADGKGGLEAAPALWNGGSADPSAAWSNITSTAVATTGTALGTGLANSDAITGQPGHTASAAQLCRAYTGGGKTDWYLPSKDELAQLQIQRATVGGFVLNNFYWSSSEYDASHAWLISFFPDGIAYPLIAKTDSYYVRPVRAFGTTPLSTEYLNDGFEGSGWSFAAVIGTNNWSIVTSGTYPTVTPYSGSKMAYFPSLSTGSGNEARIYRDSGFAIPGSVTSVTLTFFMYHDPGYATPPYDQVQVQVSTDGGSIWTNVGSAIDRYNATAGWTQHTIDLTAYNGQTVTLGFLAISQFGNNMYIDNVLVTSLN
jgi:uncharacterized repeat protein (TIGR02543 family)